MRPIRGAVAVSIAALALLAGCGTSSTTPDDANVRASYSRLVNALASHDAATVCELMFPVGQNQPRSALIAAAHRLSTPSVAAAYKRYLKSCAAGFGKEASNFTGYYNLFHGSRLGAISIHDPIATAAVVARDGKKGTALFVKAAGRWRLVIGVE
jgi:hypothetical protein